jgi:hypothetical protein
MSVGHPSEETRQMMVQGSITAMMRMMPPGLNGSNVGEKRRKPTLKCKRLKSTNKQHRKRMVRTICWAIYSPKLQQPVQHLHLHRTNKHCTNNKHPTNKHQQAVAMPVGTDKRMKPMVESSTSKTSRMPLLLLEVDHHLQVSRPTGLVHQDQEVHRPEVLRHTPWHHLSESLPWLLHPDLEHHPTITNNTTNKINLLLQAWKTTSPTCFLNSNQSRRQKLPMVTGNNHRWAIIRTNCTNSSRHTNTSNHTHIRQPKTGVATWAVHPSSSKGNKGSTVVVVVVVQVQHTSGC